MGINLEKSIKYIFEDKNWKKKILITSIFFIPNTIFVVLNMYSEFFKELKGEELASLGIFFAIMLIIYIIATIFISGYTAINTNTRILRPNSGVAEWKNFGEIFFVGFKMNLAMVIYAMIMLIAGIINFFVFFGISNGSKWAILPSFLMLIPIFIVIGTIISLANLSFLTDLKFSSFFNFNRIRNLLKGNVKQFLLYVVFIAGIAGITSLASNLLVLTIIGIVLLPTIFSVTALTASDVSAQFIRTALKIEGRENIESYQQGN